MDRKQLTRTAPPWFHLYSATPSEACDALLKLEQASGVHVVARTIRGHKASTVARLYDEFAAALQFPYYFGENWDALHDCLCDLSWLRAEAVVLCLTDAVHVLEKVRAEQLERLAEVLTSAARHCNQDAGKGRTMPFHVLLHAAPDEAADLTAKWRAAGVEVETA